MGIRDREKLGEGVIVIASATDGKVSLMATATKVAIDKGAHAGNLIKAIAGLVGGGGGGRPNMAQAGGKNPAGMEDAIAKAAEVLEGQLASVSYTHLDVDKRQIMPSAYSDMNRQVKIFLL